MSKQQIGVIGMAVMGRNLALNIERNNFSVSIYNRSDIVTKTVILENPNKKLFPFFSIKEFIKSLEKPRCVLLMVKSGIATDHTIKSLITYLEKGDIIIDGGNTFYKDTINRYHTLSKMGLNLIGAGISGGEKGALEGPSIMPGGNKQAYDFVYPIFKKIAALSEGKPCVSYIGSDGSGHYVKMVHNGIEYGDMQLISESYFLLKLLLNVDNEELSNIFNEWNQGELNSYLIEITKDILVKKDCKNNYLIDSILDEASNKGTGIWATKNALDFHVPLTLITESVFARYLSSLKSQRINASKILFGPNCSSIVYNKLDFIEKIRQGLFLGKVISYAQGFSQLKVASEKYNWHLKYSEIARIFQSGCIIRAQFLKNITQEYINNENVINLLLTSFFSKIANNYQNSLREIVSIAIKMGIAVPALSAAITYFDSYRSEFSPSNLIQAQRDLFGAHTYKKINQEGIFHTNWYN